MIKLGTLKWALLLALAAAPAAAQAPSEALPPLELYRRLRSVTLDPVHVYRVRDVRLELEDIHLALDDGTIAFTQAVDGRITGALFEGEGEVLLIPPDLVERTSLDLFTGAAILQEKFTSAYLRFSEDLFAQLRPAFRPAQEPQEFVTRWNPIALQLAEADSLRLLASFLDQPAAPQRFFRARLGGVRLGSFDVHFDSAQEEQISVTSAGFLEGRLYRDAWASFPMRSRRPQRSGRRAALASAAAPSAADPVHIAAYSIRTQIMPPTDLQAIADLSLEMQQAGARLLLFELSRYLQVQSVSADGQPLEFIQNEALQGTELARRGNDLVAVILPQPLAAGARLQLQFVYGGAVLSEAGGGLMYVGARGIWYPNRGMAMADFDLEFRYPSAWTLVATGKRVVEEPIGGGHHRSRWRSERPMPTAGFNLGQYASTSVRTGDVLVESFAASGVERSFRVRNGEEEEDDEEEPAAPAAKGGNAPAAPPVDPSLRLQVVAERSARTIEFLSSRVGPFPYGALAVTQMPGHYGQGWPGLIFLSSRAYLSPEEGRRRRSPFVELMFDRLMIAHETAHQWWGNSLIANGYRSHWMMEALANYSALLALEAESPADTQVVLDYYRRELLREGPADERYVRAGAVTLGGRLESSRFPSGWRVVTYGRGTWLLHMLRHMLRDAARLQGDDAHPDAAFLRALSLLHSRYAGQAVSNRALQQVFEEVLPPYLYFEGEASLDWFFDGWVNGTAMPRLELRSVRFTTDKGQRVATGMVVQKDAPELLVTSVPIYAETESGPMLLGRIFADGRETSFRLPAPAGARRLLLDPHQTVLTRP